MTQKLLHDPARRAVESRPAEPSHEAPFLPHRNGEIAQASRAVLAKLEASLEASQQALLARDVAALEQCTSEQLRLGRSLEMLWSRNAAQVPGNSSTQSDPASAFDLPAFNIELRAAQMRVLHLGRIQAALLGRAQRWLRTVSHLLAGLDQSYSFPASAQVPQYPASPTGIGPGVSRHTKEVGPEGKDKEGDPCRA